MIILPMAGRPPVPRRVALLHADGAFPNIALMLRWEDYDPHIAAHRARPGAGFFPGGLE